MLLAGLASGETLGFLTKEIVALIMEQWRFVSVEPGVLSVITNGTQPLLA